MLDLPMDYQESKTAIVSFASEFIPSHVLPAGMFIKIPPKHVDYASYSQLPCTEEDRAKIYKLISTIGPKGLPWLLLHKNELEKLGAEINATVHPLKFLGTIFSNAELKSDMKLVMDSMFKRSNFVKGLAKRIELELQKKQVYKFLDDFSLELHVPVNEVRHYCENSDWEGLIYYLMKH
jgi:hypothetical protein